MKINCVVVTYNRLKLLKENLDMLEKQTLPLNHIIIIDNCSTDSTADYLQTLAENPLYTVIRTEKNIGGAGGFSLGLKTSVLQGCDYTWLMDDDTIPEPTALQELIRATEGRHDIGFVCSRVNWTDNNPHEMNRPCLEQASSTDRYPRCHTCSFVSAMVSTDAVLKVGLPIKEFFIWCDDIEYTERIRLAGFDCFYVPQSIVTHKTATNYFPSIDIAPESMAWRFYYQARNTSYLKRRKCRSKILFFLAILNKYRVYRHKLSRRDRAERTEFLDAVRRGCKDGLKFNPEIEYVKP